MSAVRRFLDLSTSHLPEPVMNAPLTRIERVIAYPDVHGAWLWVPDDIDADEYEYVPSEIVTLWRHARALDCDYIRLDAGGPVDDALPTWRW